MFRRNQFKLLHRCSLLSVGARHFLSMLSVKFSSLLPALLFPSNQVTCCKMQSVQQNSELGLNTCKSWLYSAPLISLSLYVPWNVDGVPNMHFLQSVILKLMMRLIRRNLNSGVSFTLNEILRNHFHHIQNALKMTQWSKARGHH